MRPPDDDADEMEIERKPLMPKGEWLLGVGGLGALLLFGFGLGVSLGQGRAEPKPKAAVVEVAHIDAAKPTEPEAPSAPAKPEPKASPAKSVPKPPKPEPKSPPTKPEVKTPPTKPEPKKPDPPASGTPVLFADKIAAIFKNNCNVCHGAPSIKGGLDTRTLASLSKGGDNGAAVVAKDLDKSYLWGQVESGAMPPAGKDKLTAAEIKLIKDWILSGAK